jgi:ElaB/YqjD/DUF883 family membrane-anchored ribosome-binding protein
MANTDEAALGGNGHIQEESRRKKNQLEETADRALGKLADFIREKPGVALLIAVGAGFVLGRLVRRG